ncbi:hypothetical protein AX17_002784 [Amanita inopinata Kibby_2008]|nr:hypothetical protein AX17_002784 [Amanita inopinata Kibby_2008]
MRSDSHEAGDYITAGAATGACWVFKPAFGIVHPMNCAICRAYMTHLVVANQSSDLSFKSALGERETRISTAFLDGVRDGRQLQHEHDISRILQHREERDNAVQSLEQHKKMLGAAKAELDVLRDQVLALQIAFDDLLVQQRSNEGSAKSTTGNSDQSDFSSMERMLLGSSLDLDYIDEPSTPSVAPTDQEELLTIPDQSSAVGGAVVHPIPVNNVVSTKGPRPIHPTVSLSISPLSMEFQEGSSISTASPPPVQSPPAAPPTAPKTTAETGCALVARLPGPFSVQHSTSVPTKTSLSPRPLTNLAHLQALMKAAHSGDDSALTRVRSFCASAHQTPRDQRTELQRYALIHWRNRPRSASDPGQSTSLDGSVCVEIYVDASSWGIGFVMDGQWLSWKFSDSFSLVGKMTDINWAEMLAVEVGLWTVIHWANLQEQQQRGKHPQTFSVLVRSDNAGVVKAIEKRHANHQAQHDVLLRILELVGEYDIQLTMKWISSMENLADNPSRGVPGLGATLLPYVPPVPLHLSTLLIPITSPS